MLIVEGFVRRNKFEDLLKDGALDNVTKNHWIYQVNGAAERLEEQLTEMCTCIDGELHEGRFV